MAKPVEVVLMHSMPGRSRLKVPSSKGQLLLMAAAAMKLKQIPAVKEVTPRPATGSLVVSHPGAGPLSAQDLEAVGLALIGAPPAAPSFSAVRRLEPVKVGAAAMTALAFYQMSKGRALPPALTLLWYAASLITTGLHSPAETDNE
ncbi:hypothetical protein HDIA_0399 [Hartmannibacter diazotrophicus]|uniref:Uncharacterized protein n=1 Tax=Hartmannibacter diazotrophicus TaxID=1482074 RepID=A0A2C9D111_9HYPH|nr:hypothetical protein [Hartmannibacter diazotrophicus]SON53940.1 hypothetical protein HDIA_0399 [Hartmannibacter diazotrophicus]